jgi:hypothetical protein
MIKTSKNQGIALATTLWVVVLVTIFAFALLTISSLTNHFSKRTLNETLAFEAAQAGLAQAMYNISYDPTWNAGFVNQAIPSGNATYSMTFTPGQPYYSVNNFTSFSDADGYFGPATVPSGTAQLICIGTSTGFQVKKIILASIKSTATSFWGKYSLFGYKKVDVSVQNCSIDGFDSANGPYNPPAPPGHYPSGGDIGTNCWVWDAIQGKYVPDTTHATVLTNKASVYGDVFTAPGTTQSVSVQGTAGVNYNSFHNLSNQELQPSVNIPNVAAGTINGSTYGPGCYTSIPGDITLTSGIYVINGDLKITGNRTWNLNIIDGQPVKIYFNGTEWDTGGCSFQNTTCQSRNLQIIAGNNCTSMDVKGNNTGYYAVYAPNADVTIHSSANSAVYGSIVGKTVGAYSGQAYIHHDIDLDNVGAVSGAGQVIQLGWAEL